MPNGWKTRRVATVDYRRNVTGATIARGWTPRTDTASDATTATTVFKAIAAIGANAINEIIPTGAERSHYEAAPIFHAIRHNRDSVKSLNRELAGG
jgi:hypothetical protein